ncbi:uncharacterized protein NPIL_618661, partial [Nephila pilipes]
IDEEKEQKEPTLREFELQKILLQNETRRVVGSQTLPRGPKRHVKASETLNGGRQVSSREPERLPKREFSHEVPIERSPLKCYGCGKQEVIKYRCPTCNPNSSQRTDVATNHINDYTAQTISPRLTLIDITFCGKKGRVCADTGSSHSIAGEKMCQIFKETTLAMSLADGQQSPGEFFTTQVMIEIEGRSVLTRFIILPKAKGNRTLLGTDFLSSAGLILDVKNACWYFWDNPTHKYPFGEVLDTPSIAEKMTSNRCQLREGEGESLTSFHKKKLNLLLESFQNVSEPGGEATTILRQQDRRKFYADKKRKAAPTYQPGEHVFVASHPLSNAAQGISAKLMPSRDRPYVILTQRSLSSYEIASLDNPGVHLGVYHTSALTPCNSDTVKPLIPHPKRGRPPKPPKTPGSSSGRRRNQRGRM